MNREELNVLIENLIALKRSIDVEEFEIKQELVDWQTKSEALHKKHVDVLNRRDINIKTINYIKELRDKLSYINNN